MTSASVWRARIAAWGIAASLVLSSGACLDSPEEKPDYLQGHVRDAAGTPVADAAVSVVYALEPDSGRESASVKSPQDLPGGTMLRWEILDYLRRPIRTLVADSTQANGRPQSWDGMDDGGNPVPNGLYYSHVVLRNEEGGRMTLVSPLLILQSTPEFLLQHKHALTNMDGHYQIPRELLPIGEILPMYDEQGAYVGEFRISSKIRVHALRKTGERIEFVERELDTGTFPWSQALDLTLP